MGSQYLDRAITGSQAQGVPQYRLVRPRRTAGAGDGPDGWGEPVNSGHDAACLPGEHLINLESALAGHLGLPHDSAPAFGGPQGNLSPRPGLIARFWLNMFSREETNRDKSRLIAAICQPRRYAPSTHQRGAP